MTKLNTGSPPNYDPDSGFYPPNEVEPRASGGVSDGTITGATYNVGTGDLTLSLSVGGPIVVNIPQSAGNPVVSGAIVGNNLVLTLTDTSTVTIDVTTLFDNVQVASGAVVGTDIVLTMSDASTVTIDATALLADIRLQSGVYNAGTESIDFTLTDASVISVPVSSLLPVTTGASISGDGGATPLEVALSADANNAAVFGTDGGVYVPDMTGTPATAISPVADDAVGLVGTSLLYAREDHKHPAQAPSADVAPNGVNAITIGTDGLHYLGVDQLENIYNVDGVLIADRNFDLGGFILNITNGVYTTSFTAFNQQSTGVARIGSSSQSLNIVSGGVDFLWPTADGTAGQALFTDAAGNLYWDAAGGSPATAVSPAADDAVGLVGTSLLYAREDHKHPAQAPSADANNGITVGTDGLHYMAAAVPADAAPLDHAGPAGVAAIGASTDYAREDHVHRSDRLRELFDYPGAPANDSLVGIDAATQSYQLYDAIDGGGP